MSDKTQVLLFGLGALGGFYAFILGRSSHVALTVVARSNYEEVKANGLRIESENHGSHDVKLDKVIRDLSELEQVPEYIICTTKATDPGLVVPLFKDVVNTQTTFVIIQNGVGNEDPFREHYPECTILSCVAWVGAKQDSPSLIKHFAIEETKIGLFRNEAVSEYVEQERLTRFAEFLRNGQTPVTVENNVQISRWEKVIWNAAWNSVSAIAQVDSQMWIKSSDEATTTLKGLMREMLAVAQGCGLPLADDIPDRYVEEMSKLQPVYGSMYADLQHGRPLEAEVLLGTPLRKAKELGLETPVLSTFYSFVRVIDIRIRQSKA